MEAKDSVKLDHSNKLSQFAFCKMDVIIRPLSREIWKANKKIIQDKRCPLQTQLKNDSRVVSVNS